MLIKQENDCRLSVFKEEVASPSGYTQITFKREMLKDGEVIRKDDFHMYLTPKELLNLKVML